jgi:hypothetical protein
MTVEIEGGARKGAAPYDTRKEKLADSRSATCQTCGGTWSHSWALGTALEHAHSRRHKVLCAVSYSYLIIPQVPSDDDK